MGKRMWCGTLAVACAVLLAACGDSTPDTADQPAPASSPATGAAVDLPEGVTQEMVNDGRVVFETTICFTCHGMDGSGTALAPSLRDQDWLNSDGSFEGINVVRNGVPSRVQYPARCRPWAARSSRRTRSVGVIRVRLRHQSRRLS
jgi:mono/diheme cytochrome c family protein